MEPGIFKSYSPLFSLPLMAIIILMTSTASFGVVRLTTTTIIGAFPLPVMVVVIAAT